jgi:hypothetical protein
MALHGSQEAESNRHGEGQDVSLKGIPLLTHFLQPGLNPVMKLVLPNPITPQ